MPFFVLKKYQKRSGKIFKIDEDTPHFGSKMQLKQLEICADFVKAMGECP